VVVEVLEHFGRHHTIGGLGRQVGQEIVLIEVPLPELDRRQTRQETSCRWEFKIVNGQQPLKRETHLGNQAKEKPIVTAYVHDGIAGAGQVAS
jgi:hypothetical protein